MRNAGKRENKELSFTLLTAVISLPPLTSFLQAKVSFRTWEPKQMERSIPEP